MAISDLQSSVLSSQHQQRYTEAEAEAKRTDLPSATRV